MRVWCGVGSVRQRGGRFTYCLPADPHLRIEMWGTRPSSLYEGVVRGWVSAPEGRAVHILPSGGPTSQNRDVGHPADPHLRIEIWGTRFEAEGSWQGLQSLSGRHGEGEEGGLGVVVGVGCHDGNLVGAGGDEVEGDTDIRAAAVCAHEKNTEQKEGEAAAESLSQAGAQREKEQEQGGEGGGRRSWFS